MYLLLLLLFNNSVVAATVEKKKISGLAWTAYSSGNGEHTHSVRQAEGLSLPPRPPRVSTSCIEIIAARRTHTKNFTVRRPSLSLSVFLIREINNIYTSERVKNFRAQDIFLPSSPPRSNGTSEHIAYIYIYSVHTAKCLLLRRENGGMLIPLCRPG